jgi:Arc/MetJ-type ribon-helix-helix transcriptional regulator
MSYSSAVGRSIHVRLDSESESALSILRNCGMNESEAVRAALIETAAQRLTPEAIRAEVERIAADPLDRENSMEVLRFMESLDLPDATEYP